MTAVIIVPWRDRGDARRRDNLGCVLDHLLALNLAPVHVTGDGRTGPFNRSAAYNRGRAEHPAEVYVWHEADMLVPRAQLAAAITDAAQQPGLVIPFTEYLYLSPDDSNAVLTGADVAACTPERVMGDGRSIGAVGVTSEATMRSVGQWDEVFQGWGYDDNAMKIAFDVAAGRTRWVKGTAAHLFHTPGWTLGTFSSAHAETLPEPEQAATEANRRRLKFYKAARTARQIRNLTSGGS